MGAVVHDACPIWFVMQSPKYEAPSRLKRASCVRELAPAGARQTTGARSLVDALVAAGVDTFFGIPGGPVSPVFDAVLQNGRARLVESRHESAAAFAAVGYHRASGRVPAVIVTAGPGATNAVTGIVSAHLERVPMLVICGDVAWAASGGRLFQDSGPEGIDVEQMLARFMRATVRVAQARSAATQALAALHAATDPERPGPALLVVPIHNGAGTTQTLRVARGRVVRSLVPPRDAVIEAYEILREAERPLIVLGAGCRPWAAEVRRLLDVLEIPFVTTPRGKGIVSELHPRSLRQGGFAASMWARRYTRLDEEGRGVDAALVLGTDLDDCSVGPTPYIGQGGKLVHVDSEAAVFNRNFPAALAILADIGAFVGSLYGLVLERGFRKNPGVSALLRAIKASSPFELPSFESDASVVITPQRAISDLERAAGEGARFVADIGEHTLFALHYLTAKGPDAFDVRLGLGSMGSGIASAIGLALGDRSRRVVCVCGDGGMQMAGMEALVAIREQLPIFFAVFNDARYNMVYHGYKQVFGREAPWESPWVDFVRWAEALGMRGARIHSPGEIDSDLFDRLSSGGGPAVLDIRIDRDVQMSGGGRNEALLHMSMMGEKG
jgi:acetolactate synthase-1/2/3 large subunit